MNCVIVTIFYQNKQMFMGTDWVCRWGISWYL